MRNDDLYIDICRGSIYEPGTSAFVLIGSKDSILNHKLHMKYNFRTYKDFDIIEEKSVSYTYLSLHSDEQLAKNLNLKYFKVERN